MASRGSREQVSTLGLLALCVQGVFHVFPLTHNNDFAMLCACCFDALELASDGFAPSRSFVGKKHG